MVTVRISVTRGKRVDAPEAARQRAMRSVAQRLGTSGWDRRATACSGKRRGQGAWIKADGAIQIVCGQPQSRSISATIRHCWSTARPADRRSPPRLRSVVLRHDPHRPVRRRADGRRGFHRARRRGEFRRPARAGRGGAARHAHRQRARRSRSCARATSFRASGEANAARQVIRISTNVRAGDREMVRVRPLCASPRTCR